MVIHQLACKLMSVIQPSYFGKEFQMELFLSAKNLSLQAAEEIILMPKIFTMSF